MVHIREWAAAICAAAILCSTVEMMSPPGRQSKMLKVIMSAVMLCLLVSPLTHIRECTGQLAQDISHPDYIDSRLCRTVEEQTASAMDNAVKKLICECLESIDINAEEISVDMDISEDGCISIGQATVRINDQYISRAQEIRDVLYSRLGLEVNLIIPEEKNGA